MQLFNREVSTHLFRKSRFLDGFFLWRSQLQKTAHQHVLKGRLNVAVFAKYRQMVPSELALVEAKTWSHKPVPRMVGLLSLCESKSLRSHDFMLIALRLHGNPAKLNFRDPREM